MDDSLPLMEGRRFEFLDGLRGIAALMVTCLHFHTLVVERTSAYFPAILEHLFKNGHFGVQIFFVLSGFVIAYSIRNEIITPSFFMRFFARRSLRLDPPYWMTLIMLTALIYIGSMVSGHSSDYMPDLSTFTVNAFYLPGFMGAEYILPVAWTLCMEFQFYIFFVLLIAMIQQLNCWKGFDVFDYSSPFGPLLLSPVLIISLMEASGLNLWNSVPGLFVPHWYSFFCGTLVCWSLLGKVKNGYFWMTMLGISLCSVVELNADMAVTLVTAFMILIVARLNKLHRALRGPVFQYLGKVSYSLYLIHWPIGIKFMTFLLFVFGPGVEVLPSMALMLMALAVTLLATHFFYRCIEYPSMQLCKRVGKVSGDLTIAKVR